MHAQAAETMFHKSMNASERAGQCMMVRIFGDTLTNETRAFLTAHHIRAVCLFRQNMRDEAQLRRLIADLQEVLGPAALIAIDQEGGAVMRTTWLPEAPSAMCLGAANDSALCSDVGAAVARAIKALGFNWNFAPVLDVNSNPHNPVIAERAFGDDPSQVAVFANAWMQASLREGVATCLKHFPGHGDTRVDSHRALPVVNKPRQELEQQEFLPFQQCAAFAPAMMTAHIVYPQLDPDLPATLSRTILQDILRDAWGYDGVVITDSMEMQAISDHFGAGAAAVMALQAGADMVMALGSVEEQEATWQALCEAINSGVIAAENNDHSLRRLQLLVKNFPSTQSAYHTREPDEALMARAWRQGLSSFGQVKCLPLASKIRLVMRNHAQSDGVTERGVSVQEIQDLLATKFDVQVTTFEQAESFDWAALPDDGRLPILVSSTRARYPQQVRETWKPALHVALWSPYQVLDIDAPALMTFGFARPALHALLACLCGEVALPPQTQLKLNLAN